MESSKISKLKLCKKVLLFVLSGTITLSTVGCSKKNIELSSIENEVNNDDYQDDNIIYSNNLGYEKEILENPEIANIEKPIDIYVYKDDTYGYLKENVSLRKSIDTKSEKIAKIETYEKVELLEKSEGWTLVKYNKKKVI